ncbi:hypothetical protein Tco_0874865 [Tanacetum coccineum]|uniref:Uncharacterized protein n=1 Tax=Tanacetum coccineum TaxID=301880 RepID=A0ABQ5BPJ6_9ASTR
MQMVTEKPKPEMANDDEVANIEKDPQATLEPDRGKGLAKDTNESPKKLVPTSKEVHLDPDALVLITYEINGKLYHLTNEEIREHMELEERKEKAAQEPNLLALSKPGGQEFIKKQDAEIKVHNREHFEKLKKAKELRKKRIDEYRWTTSSRFKLEKITDIHIHPNTKPIAITVYKDNEKRNFDVHKPFRFGDFDVTEWDELGAIIHKKKNKVVEDPMTSLQKKYKRLKVIHGEIGISPSLPPPKQFPFLSSGKKGRHKMIQHPEQGIFFIDVFGDKAFQRISDIHKVAIDTLLSYLVMASNINIPKNQRFCAVMRSLIDSHLDKEKLKSKKVKLEAIRY